MPFYLRNDTEQWFSHIKEQAPIETKFDLYYFCLMMGFATGRTSVPSQRSEVTEFQKNYAANWVSTSARRIWSVGWCWNI